MNALTWINANATTLVVVIPILVVTISALIGPILFYLLKRRSEVFRLRLAIGNRNECLPKSVVVWGGGPKYRRHARLTLINVSPGSGVATQCCVKLLSIFERVGGKLQPIEYPNPKPLRWNEEGKNEEGKPVPFAKKNLHHGEPQYVDVLYTELDGEKVRVVLKDEPYTKVGLTIGKTYHFKVQATAEGAKAVTKKFDVIIGLKYDDICIKWGWWRTVGDPIR